MRGLDLDYPRVLLLAVLVLVNLAIVASMITAGAALGPFNHGWDGGRSLHDGAEAAGAEATAILSTSHYPSVDPPDTTAVVLGPTRSYEPGTVAELRAFLNRGGRLLVAADGNETNDLLRELGVRSTVDGALLRDEQHNAEDPAFPVARNVSTHPLTQGVDELVLNRGSALDAAEAQVLVNSSSLSYLDRNRNGSLDDDEVLRSRPVATVESLGDGSVVVVSDPEVFANAMLERPGNARFLRNLVGDRSRVLVDYSHSPPLAPLAYAFVTVRNSPLVQFALGGLLVTAVLAVGLRRRSGRDAFGSARPGGSGAPAGNGGKPPAVSLGEDDLRRYLKREHPDWDPDRLERVTEAIIRQRGQGEADD